MYRAQFICPICGGQAESTIKFLDRKLNAETLANCSGCGARYYQRDRGWQEPIIEKAPEDLPFEFTKAAADALCSAINAAFHQE
jgi:hypothetical protein